MIVVEREHSLAFVAAAELLVDDREIAWAERYVTYKNPAYAYVLGKYVEADRANGNRQLFPLKALEEAVQTLIHAPLNINHQANRVVGTYIGSEMVYPKDEGINPVMEALAVIWKHQARQEYANIQRASEQKQLAFSLEALPRSISCAGEEGCGFESPYLGPTSPLYCSHLNTTASKQINRPHFTGGALVLPPDKPAWRGATVDEMGTYVDDVYEQIAEEFPELDAPSWETLMSVVLGER